MKKPPHVKKPPPVDQGPGRHARQRRRNRQRAAPRGEHGKSGKLAATKPRSWESSTAGTPSSAGASGGRQAHRQAQGEERRAVGRRRPPEQAALGRRDRSRGRRPDLLAPAPRQSSRSPSACTGPAHRLASQGDARRVVDHVDHLDPVRGDQGHAEAAVRVGRRPLRRAAARPAARPRRDGGERPLPRGQRAEGLDRVRRRRHDRRVRLLGRRAHRRHAPEARPPRDRLPGGQVPGDPGRARSCATARRASSSPPAATWACPRRAA